MALQKTIILSTSDPAKAKKQYEKELGENVLFVALGNTPDIEQMIKQADVIAGDDVDLRKVIWAKKPDLIAGKISQHDRSSDLRAVNLNAPDKAYTLSFSSVIRDIIGYDEDDPDNLRIFKSYVKAEADEE